MEFCVSDLFSVLSRRSSSILHYYFPYCFSGFLVQTYSRFLNARSSMLNLMYQYLVCMWFNGVYVCMHLHVQVSSDKNSIRLYANQQKMCRCFFFQLTIPALSSVDISCVLLCSTGAYVLLYNTGAYVRIIRTDCLCLTTCHTQYTWVSSICVFFLLNRTTLQALYVHPLWFYRVIQNYCRGFNNLSYTIHLR